MNRSDRMLSFQVPGSRLCIDTMQSWLDGEPVWPYRKVIEVWGREYVDFLHRIVTAEDAATFIAETKFDRQRSVNRELALHEVRYEYVARFGFAIPCKELLDALAAAGPIVEVGAGSGYMTALMRRRGIDVIGSDAGGHKEDSGHGFIIAEYDPQQVNGVEAKSMIRRYPDRTVFCSWPTYSHTWFRQALRAMQIGQTLIFIGEECTADGAAWKYLDDCFEQQQTITLPVFPCLHDRAGVYVKRKQDVQPKARSSMLGGRRSLSRRRATRNPRPLSKAA